MRTIRIALLGCGAVGGEVARLLCDSRERIREACGIDLRLSRILVRDVQRARPGIEPSLFTGDFEDIARDRPNAAIEVLGGCAPARDFANRLLERGVTVVSANKTLLAHHGPELQATAERSGAGLAYEASVGAAIPVLAVVRHRCGEPVAALRATLNGTCNYILSRMRDSGLPLNAVLREAIEHGFAEPDPTADVSGRDAAEKLCLLARAAGLDDVKPADVETAGIANITPRDLDAAREHGCVVRLVAELETSAHFVGGVRLRVGPMFVPCPHPLARAKNAENVIVIDQDRGGRLVLHGEGAGPKPTSAAILADLLNAVGARPHAAIRARQCTAVTIEAAGRSFIRVPRSHEAAESLQRCADHVHARRGTIEAIVEGDEFVRTAEMFIAPVLQRGAQRRA